MLIMTMLIDVLQEYDVLYADKDDVRCFGKTNRFQVVKC
jgi:hypothetical protein